MGSQDQSGDDQRGDDRGGDAETACGVLDGIRQAGAGGEVTLGEVVDALDRRGFGPLLFVPALLGVSPLGVVPGVPSLIALVVLLAAAQVALGREHVWVPGFLRRLSVSEERMGGALDKLRPVARWLDRWFHRRLAALTTPAAARGAAACAALLCLAVPPLELVPLAALLPFGAIAAFGLALTLHDGLLMALGYLLTAGAVAAGLGLLG